MKPIQTISSLVIALSFVSLSAFAEIAQETMESRISFYDLSPTAAETSHFYLENEGRVVRVNPDQPEVTRQLEHAYLNGDSVSITVENRGDHDEVISLETFPTALVNSSVNLDLNVDPDTTDPVAPNVEAYRPSDFGTYANAQTAFRSMHQRFRRKSECYQRAHYWAYEMSRQYNVNTMKVFLFFTTRYIRTYNYDWWFHVSPYTFVNGVEYVLDRSFTAKPLLMKEWTDEFMHNRAPCPVVRTYSDYSRNQGAQYCYLAKVPMYYYQPLDVLNMEKGIYLNTWRASSLSHARSAVR